MTWTQRCLMVSLGVALLAARIGGTEDSDPRPVAISPGSHSQVVRIPGDCPTFHWTALEDAQAYELAIWSLADSKSLPPRTLVPRGTVHLPAGASGWTPSLDDCLEGGRYAWTVRAWTEVGGGSWSEPALFEVSMAPTAGEVQRALRVIERHLANQGLSEQIPSSTGTLGALSAEELEPARTLESARGRPSSSASTHEQPAPEAAPLSSPTLGATPPPRTVVPGTYSLKVSGDIGLGGAVFQDGYSLLHTDGGEYYLNTALGRRALDSATPGPGGPYGKVGAGNTALGDRALTALTTGERNTALGAYSLVNNNGLFNTAVGFAAMQSNTSGRENVAVGMQALKGGQASRNTAVGALAMRILLDASDDNTVIGHGALRSLELYPYGGGDHNIAVGVDAGLKLREGNHNIFIGADAAGYVESATIRIGDSDQTKTYVAGIWGEQPSGTSRPVVADSQGQLGTPLIGYLTLSFADATCATNTIPITGAAVGNLVLLGPPTLGPDLLATAWVSAADTVTVRVCHANGGTLGGTANGTYGVALIG